LSVDPDRRKKKRRGNYSIPVPVGRVGLTAMPGRVTIRNVLDPDNGTTPGSTLVQVPAGSLSLSGRIPVRALGNYRVIPAGAISISGQAAGLSIGSNEGVLAFPGALGFNRAGRHAFTTTNNPTYIKVTNLADSGAGSFRAAVTATGPRVVIFEVSGTITLLTAIFITEPYLYIVGQTALSPGITIKGQPVYLYNNAHDTLIRHIRFRSGFVDNEDCITLYGSNTFNLSVDHCSLSWSADENWSMAQSYTGDSNADIQRSIISEPLANHGSFEVVNAWANALVSNQRKKCSIIRCLIAHGYNRNPSLYGGSSSYVANNFIYNWGEICTFYDDPDSFGPIIGSLVGNVYKRGPSTPASTTLVYCRYLQAGSQVYIADTLKIGANLADFEVVNNDGIDPRVGSPPITVPGYTPIASSAVQADMVNWGARPLDRDAVDNRIMSDAINGTGFIITNPSDVGGWPALANNPRGLTVPANASSIGASGYTVGEEWIAGYTAEVQ